MENVLPVVFGALEIDEFQFCTKQKIVCADDERVVGIMEADGPGTNGVRYDQRYVHLFGFRDGKIAQVWSSSTRRWPTRCCLRMRSKSCRASTATDSSSSALTFSEGGTSTQRRYIPTANRSAAFRVHQTRWRGYPQNLTRETAFETYRSASLYNSVETVSAAARPTAAMTKYPAFASSTPAVASIADLRWPASESEPTSNTEGPGLRHKTNSIVQNQTQCSIDMAVPFRPFD